MVGRVEVLVSRPELADPWRAADALFPVRVTRSWWDRVDPADPNDPLARQVLPDAAELEVGPDALVDPVGDALRSPVPWVVCKHADRVLLLVTKRCHLYCRYCFRRTFSPSEREDPTPEELDVALAWIRRSGAREVILSGGDPLAVRDETLMRVIDALQPTVPRVRIHTRAPITRPERVTPELVAALRARAPVWVVVHCNHPRELSADVDTALARLVDGGIPVLNQGVLLRGVNDDVDTLVDLFEALARRRVQPYYLHHPDAVPGAGHFRVAHDEGLALVEQVRARIGGLAMPAYVIDPPEGTGKTRVSEWLRERAGQGDPC